MSAQPELNFDRKHASQAPTEIVEKIRKLLRMEKGGSAGEAENALRLARQLADKHNIDLQSVVSAESSPFATMTHRAIRISLSSIDDSYANQIIINFFNVDSVYHKHYDYQQFSLARDLTIIGTEIDVEIAIYVFTFLQTHFKACWRRRNKRLRNRKSFMHGVFAGLCAKLQNDRGIEMNPRDGKKALVLSREAYTKQLFPNLVEKKASSPKKLSDAARMAGYGAGFATNIRQPIAGATTPSQLLLK